MLDLLPSLKVQLATLNKKIWWIYTTNLERVKMEHCIRCNRMAISDRLMGTFTAKLGSRFFMPWGYLIIIAIELAEDCSWFGVVIGEQIHNAKWCNEARLGIQQKFCSRCTRILTADKFISTCLRWRSLTILFTYFTMNDNCWKLIENKRNKGTRSYSTMQG